MLSISCPTIGNAEIKRVTKVLKSGLIAQGPEVEKLEIFFAQYCGVKYAVAFNSGTAAIHAGLYALDIQEGDEVIAPPFTFVATASPILMQKAKVVFADISETDFCLDPLEVKKKITHRTKAIIPVDLYGQIYNSEAIGTLAQRYGLKILEDACQAVGAERNGKKAGSFGQAAAFSLYATKNITCGEGGILTTNDFVVAEKAKRLRHHGQSEKQQYEYVDLGYNYRMTDIQAAIAIEQLKKVDQLNERRIHNAEQLTAGLVNIPGLILPMVQKNTHHVFHQYTVRITEAFKTSRSSFIDYLHRKGIGAGIYYPKPLHLCQLFSNYGYQQGDFPVSEKIAKEVVSLPIHPYLTQQNIKYMISTINKYAK